MRKTTLILMVLLASTAWATGKEGESFMLDNIRWLGHDTFILSAQGKTIYTDPFRISKGSPMADIILITHEHYDHCSPDDVEKIASHATAIITTADCAPKLDGDIRIVTPGDRITIEDIEIGAVRAYNTNKKFHPITNNWVGFVFKAGGITYYLAGDTDRIPEMKDIECDVALLPVSGTYVMTADEAAEAALDIKPKVVVPMHYGAIVGEAPDAVRLSTLLKGKIEVRILPQE